MCLIVILLSALSPRHEPTKRAYRQHVFVALINTSHLLQKPDVPIGVVGVECGIVEGKVAKENLSRACMKASFLHRTGLELILRIDSPIERTGLSIGGFIPVVSLKTLEGRLQV